jgi:hypothetical protein
VNFFNFELAELGLPICGDWRAFLSTYRQGCQCKPKNCQIRAKKMEKTTMHQKSPSSVAPSSYVLGAAIKGVVLFWNLDLIFARPDIKIKLHQGASVHHQ